MKKLLIIALSLILWGGSVAVGGAEDRLTINGDYGVRAIYIDNPVFDAAAEAPGETVEYFHQRFRTDMNFTLADDLSAQLRADWAENAWGENNHPIFATPEAEKDADGNVTSIFNILQIEYANVKIDKNLWFLSVGLDSSFDYGLGDVYRPHGYGFKLRLKLPVTIALDLTKWSEGGSRIDSATFDDTNMYSLQVAGNVGGFSIGAFYANIHDLQQENMKQAVEVFGRGKIGPVALTAAVDYIFGEQVPSIDRGGSADLAGTISAIVDAGVSITPAFKTGAHLYYTSPNDDPTKANDGGLYVWGPAPSFISYGMPGLTWDGIGYELGFQNRTVIGGNAGQYGADIYANYTIKPFTFGVQVMYFIPADDDMTNIDSKLGIGGGLSYDWRPNVIMGIGAVYADNTYDTAPEPDDPFGVQANFLIFF